MVIDDEPLAVEMVKNFILRTPFLNSPHPIPMP